MRICKEYLKDPAKPRDAAAILISRALTRPDSKDHDQLLQFFKFCQGVIAEGKDQIMVDLNISAHFQRLQV